MPGDRATALAAVSPSAPEGADDGALTITAESFRQLTARLKAGKAPPPPAPDNVIQLRKALPRAAEPDPVPELDPQPEPPVEAVATPVAEVSVIPPPEPEVPPAGQASQAEDEAGETALTLLEMMAATTGLLPQERALAADTLLLLLPRVPVRQIVRLAERVAIMDNPPPLLAERLIRDPRPEIMVPVLERSANICDRDMIAATALTDLERLRVLARRRVLSPVLSGHVVASGDPGVIFTLLRNQGAELPHQCFADLCRLAIEHPELRAPLATRAELPAEAAFELYWNLRPELRRLMLSRFLTDSGTLGRILRIALAEDAALSGRAPQGEGPADAAALDAALEAAASAASKDDLARQFAELAGIAEETARRILSDRLGEPAAVLLKALGVSRARFVEAMAKLRAGGLLEASDSNDLQIQFDGLSFTKARVLVTYWDWFTRRAGPYASWHVAQLDIAAPC